MREVVDDLSECPLRSSSGTLSNSLGFLHPHMQRDKKISVACHVGPHGVALDGGGVDALTQPVRQAQHHGFFMRAAGADGARVFPAVAGVQGNDDQAVGVDRGG